MVALPQTIISGDRRHQAAVRQPGSDFDAVIRASSIGKLARHLWYRFRWAHLPERFDGQTTSCSIPVMPRKPA